MGKGLWVSEESYDEVHPRKAKISFSKKLKLSTEDCAGISSRQNRNGALGDKRDMFFARIGGFPQEGVHWIVDNFKNMKLNLNLPENLGGGAFHGKAQQRVSVARKAGRRQPLFARTAERFDPQTQEKLEEIKEDLEEVKEDVVDTAQKARVPVPSASLPYIGFIHSLTIKDLMCGVLAGAVASTFAVPFDIVTTRVIAGKGGQSVAQVVSTVAQKEGLQSLFKGSLKVNILLHAFEKGMQFTTFEAVKRNQVRSEGTQKKVLPLPKQIPVATAGGAAAGFVGTLLSYPVQPAFNRLLLAPDKYSGLQDALLKIVRNEGGVRELYRGIVPALIAIVPSAAVSFYTYETLKTKYLTGRLTNDKKQKGKKELEALGSLIIGGLAGVVSTIATYPLDLARKEILMSALPSSAVHFAGAANNAVYNNTWQALRGIAETQGFSGLYRGLPAQVLQIAPMTAITFMVYELSKRAFVASGEESRDEVKDADDLKKGA